MITNQELNAVKLSPTKKDFYQIWNELLDTAGKISERWDPVSTNESDPGIVLLKVLTAVADKLNYNIDANTLEAFMPSAAQEESMRKLTEMLGYSMKYYQSATTEVKISYDKNTDSPIQGVLIIDKFTNIKDIDDSINYVTLAPVNLTRETPFGNVDCMEGELVECETADNNIVSLFHLDDNKRYFLPETQIAENSIFITNIENNIEGTEWKKVSNLNAQSLGSKVFKFGFDSQERLPYIQFPEDISTIIEDGLRIKYIRTSGSNGNISVNTLSKLTTPLSWSAINPDNKMAYHDVANFTVTNIRAATNGTDKEGINAAYNNFKKTVGTFDTLVTCRDYMNKIYQLVSSVDNTTPLVSNIIVSDIKSDINRAVTLGTFTSRGIEYKVKAKPGKSLTNFDLMLYPFKSTYGLNSQQEFNKSFKYDNSNYAEIITDLEDTKTLAHNFKSPSDTELACIKNYYRLRAKINTVRKVGVIEQASILNNVYKKLFETFNMRQLDFGEEIPYDILLQVIETADPRIKNISLDEPSLSTKFMTAGNKEVDISSEGGKEYYNALVLNNVLAGRVPLFNYYTDFSTDYGEKAYSGAEYAATYPTDTADTSEIHKIRTEFQVPLEAINPSKGLTLKLTEQEVIQFKAPSLKTTATYPAYVNYYLHLNKTGTSYVAAIPATMQTLRDFLRGGPNASDTIAKYSLEYYINETAFPTHLITELSISEELRKDQVAFKARFDEIIATNCAIFILTGTTYEYVTNSDAGWELIRGNSNTKFYTLAFDKSMSSSTGVASWSTWLTKLTKARLDHADEGFGDVTEVDKISLKGFYKVNGGNLQGNAGYLIDQEGLQYRLVETPKDIATIPFNYYYVPRIWLDEAVVDTTEVGEAKNWHTKNGLGQDAQPFELPKNGEYELRDGEYFLVNWTQSKDSNSDEKEEHWKTYSKGHIIKPNFMLSDSEDWHKANHSYTKLNVASKFEAFPDLPGMFTLGTNEQVEIREFIQVKLNGTNTNLYWEIPGLLSTAGGYVEFPFNEAPLNKATGEPWKKADEDDPSATKFFTEYTLKEGEYLYYTDMNKSDIAFYGFGSTIKRGLNTPTIFKYTSDDVISTTEISTNGINASIPWRNYNLSGEKSELVITENQFINLTTGDELLSLDVTDKGMLDNDFVTVGANGASWKTNSGDTEAESEKSPTNSLPVLKFSDDRFKWQVRSKLNLAVGPYTYQTLKTKSIPDTDKEVKDVITLVNTIYSFGVGTDTDLVPSLMAASPDKPLSFKTNKIVQSAATTTDVTDKKVDTDGNLEEIQANLQIKLFEHETVTNTQGQIINFGNYGDGSFTTINFEEQLSQTTAESTVDVEFTLNALLPETTFGLVMVYYQKLNPDNATPATISWEIPDNVNFYNNTGTIDNSKISLSLKEGVNILQIGASDRLKINSRGNNKSVITFGKLDLVSIANPLNPKLCYKVPTKTSFTASEAYTQILSDIETIDTENEFYYNMPVEQNLDIDMNPNDATDTLENPLNWFNYNNINNKFVISEIDTEYLTDDIVIAKSSRSNF